MIIWFLYMQTELCRSWEEFGSCRYGSKCQFAHSREELRPVQRHPKYKTEICRTFATTGTCPYGTRCRFIHQSTALAQLRTAKAGQDNGSSIVGNAASQMNGQEPTLAVGGSAAAGAGALASAQVGSSRLPSITGTPQRITPSFANVASGAVKVGGGPVQTDMHATIGSLAGSLGGNAPTSSVVGEKNIVPNFAAVAAGTSNLDHQPRSTLSPASASFQPTGMISAGLKATTAAEYETALTAALDVLHCSDDPMTSQEKDMHTASASFLGTGPEFMMNGLSVQPSTGIGSNPATPTRAASSLPTSPAFSSTLLQSGDGSLGLGQPAPVASSLGSSTSGRRLPVFSSLAEK